MNFLKALFPVFSVETGSGVFRPLIVGHLLTVGESLCRLAVPVNELIQKTGIKKSHLSQCIKTSKDRPYDREGWKKWIGKDERKYGFVEILK